MNGAEVLLRTLVNGGVEVCFMNPGTSEMQFVAAVDRVAGMRCVLGLFEGVVSGAADGYARMTGKPAATLLHLGPGLANALANFHNARRARSPIVSIIGEHATYHRECDPPLYSDIAALSRPVSGWIRTVEDPDEIPVCTHAAIQAACGPPGQIATLVIPADCAWKATTAPVNGSAVSPDPAVVDERDIHTAAEILLSGEPVALIVNGQALLEEGLLLAGRIRTKTGARVFCDCFVPRLQRGAGRPALEIIPYFTESALQLLGGLKHAILIGAREPVGFFAYPGLPNRLLPADCRIQVLAGPGSDAQEVLQQLADATGANNSDPEPQALQSPDKAIGALTALSIAQSIAALMPDQAIVVDEAITSGIGLLQATVQSPPHDWLFNCGGSLGQGLPVATGAAIASPDRKVLALEADGSGMYTLQALWTQVRESLNVTTVIYANREYRILNIEHQRVGAGAPGAKAHDMMSLDRPGLDWVKLALGMGVPAKQVTTADEFSRTLEIFLKQPGPNLIEAVI